MKLITFIFVVLVFPSTTYCQDIIRTEGDKSLNFSFDNLAIEQYKYGIGGKYLYSDDLALVGSINIGQDDQ